MVDKCDKHDATMDRIFEKINHSEKKLESIDTKMCMIIEFKDMIHNIVFGNGKEGIISKVSRNFAQLILQWGLLLIIITMILKDMFK